MPSFAVASTWPNRLLASLKEEDQEALHPYLEPVTLDYRRALYDADRRVEFVHFIESGVASLVNTLADGVALEVGTVGNEERLEDAACECYAINKTAFDRLLGAAALGQALQGAQDLGHS
jgi:hypothetical protein